MKKITFLIVLLCSFAQAQDFKQLYVDALKDTWEVYETESFAKSVDPKMDSLYLKTNEKGYAETLIENQKDAVASRANKLSEIIGFFNIELSKLDSLTIIEEKSLNNSTPMDFTRKGVILIKDSIYGFEYNSEKEKSRVSTIDYFKNSENAIVQQAKQIIGNLIISGNADSLTAIAKVESEMLAGPLKKIQPETEFEIILYTKNSEDKFRTWYLHETFVQILNQK